MGRAMPPRTTIAMAVASVSLLAGACGPQSSGAAADTPSSGGSTAVAAATAARAVVDALTITRGGARPVQAGPAEQFTGAVRVEMLFTATDSSRAAGASVSFAPGARTAWHRHPRGQVLVVTAGTGRVQRRGGPVEEIRAGDVVWTPPNVEHWHGAAPTTAMTHLAIQEHLNGTMVDWLAHVTDTEYQPGPAAH